MLPVSGLDSVLLQWLTLYAASVASLSYALHATPCKHFTSSCFVTMVMLKFALPLSEEAAATRRSGNQLIVICVWYNAVI